MTKLDPKNYVVPPGTAISNIDLDSEEFIHDGKRLTEAEAGRIAERVLETTGRGRPSLSRHGNKSPQLGVRVSNETFDKLHKRADAEGKRVSEIVREAIEHYV